MKLVEDALILYSDIVGKDQLADLLRKSHGLLDPRGKLTIWRSSRDRSPGHNSVADWSGWQIRIFDDFCKRPTPEDPRSVITTDYPYTGKGDEKDRLWILVHEMTHAMIDALSREGKDVLAEFSKVPRDQWYIKIGDEQFNISESAASEVAFSVVDPRPVSQEIADFLSSYFSMVKNP